MKGLREKICKREGFTLVEMLIVVAIIAILIMVSIPMVNSSLEKARHAVDQANLRSAFALGNVKVLTDNIKTDESWVYIVDGDADEGKNTNPQGHLENTGEGVKAKCKYCPKGSLIVTYTANTGVVEAKFAES